jgi:putative OPT family oligopeptide transporter
MWQQVGELVGAVVSALTIGGVMYLLNAAWGFGDSVQLPAPQATLMKLVVEGVMGGTLPWGLVFCGIFIAVVVEILGLPVLSVAIGLYLPIHLSAPIFAGGLLRWFLEGKKTKNVEEEKQKKDCIDRGVLYSSGLIAGEGLIGILLAILAIIPYNKSKSIADFINVGQPLGNIGGLIFFLLLLASIIYFARKSSDKRVEK